MTTLEKFYESLEDAFLKAQKTYESDMLGLMSDVLNIDFSLSNCPEEIFDELAYRTGDGEFAVSMANLFAVLPVGCPPFYEKALQYIRDAKIHAMGTSS